jgi:hypothetical protein
MFDLETFPISADARSLEPTYTAIAVSGFQIIGS